MVYLGFEPGAVGWKAQTNPLNLVSTPYFSNIFNWFFLPLIRHIYLIRICNFR